jgi:tRNA threonylcarbamoyladenosine biosynthesis protein TsaE
MMPAATNHYMSDSFSITLNSESETESLGFRIGEILRPAMVIGLCGTLGSGKTRLTQAIAKSLGIEEPVVSPTYTICVPYSGRLKLLHMDAYRIEHAEEVDELDLFERVEDGEVLIVEWADRIEPQLPDIDLWIKMEPREQTVRQFYVESRSKVGERFVEELRGHES